MFPSSDLWRPKIHAAYSADTPVRVPSSRVCSSPDDRGTNRDARDVAVVQRAGQLYAFVRIVPRWRRAHSTCLQSVCEDNLAISPGANLRPLVSASVLQHRNHPYELVRGVAVFVYFFVVIGGILSGGDYEVCRHDPPYLMGVARKGFTFSLLFPQLTCMEP